MGTKQHTDNSTANLFVQTTDVANSQAGRRVTQANITAQAARQQPGVVILNLQTVVDETVLHVLLGQDGRLHVKPNNI